MPVRAPARNCGSRAMGSRHGLPENMSKDTFKTGNLRQIGEFINFTIVGFPAHGAQTTVDGITGERVDHEERHLPLVEKRPQHVVVASRARDAERREVAPSEAGSRDAERATPGPSYGLFPSHRFRLRPESGETLIHFQQNAQSTKKYQSISQEFHLLVTTQRDCAEKFQSNFEVKQLKWSWVAKFEVLSPNGIFCG